MLARSVIGPLFLLLATTFVEAATRPNILLIVSDDQGYRDAGFQGGTQIPTPHLDRIRDSGIRCTSGYASHPFCSPTRAGLMTGRYQQRFGHEMNPVYDPTSAREGLPLGETLLPQFLQRAGYRTAWVGKWHLGAAPALTPEARGFDETFGFLGGGHHFRNWKPGTNEYQIPVRRNGQDEPVDGHLTTRFGVEASAFVKRQTNDPWFLYLAFNAPHSPHEPTADARARFSHVAGARGAYCAQVALMDDAIGAVLSALDETGQRDRTLIFFIGDNGGQTQTAADNGTLRARKGTVYEGGIRVPFLVSWPDRLPAGGTFDAPVMSFDAFGTALAAAGVDPGDGVARDAVDLVPYLAGKRTISPHTHLFWRVGGGLLGAVREGDWKLVRQHGKPDELYNLASDISEQKDRAAAEPDRLRALVDAYARWDATLVPPAFRGLGDRKPAQQR